jgi:hypothetical protein
MELCGAGLSILWTSYERVCCEIGHAESDCTPELDAIFVSNRDKTGAQLPPAGELRKYWDEVNGKLLSQFAGLSENEWLQRHNAMSEEDYAKDPTRNRLAVLLSRTNHMSYHWGRLTLALK